MTTTNDKFEVFNAVELLQKPAPRRQWLAEPWIPLQHVTLLYGSADTSTLALQLCASTSAGNHWLGMTVTHAPALYVSCEDDLDAIRYRIGQIATHMPHPDLAQLHVVSLAGQDAIMAPPRWPLAGVRSTSCFSAIEEAMERLDARFLVLDSAADVFGGMRSPAPSSVALFSFCAAWPSGEIVLWC